MTFNVLNVWIRGFFFSPIQWKFKKKHADFPFILKKYVFKDYVKISPPNRLLFSLTVSVGKPHLQTAAIWASFSCPVIDLQPDLKEPPSFKVRSYSFTIIALFQASLAETDNCAQIRRFCDPDYCSYTRGQNHYEISVPTATVGGHKVAV